MADVRIFSIGAKVSVLLNWDSFVNLGIDPGWQDAFSNAIVTCCTRWAHVAGVDCRHEFAGLTTNTTAAAGQVVISMNDHHADTNRLASTFASSGSAVIIFHRKSGATLTPWNFVPYQANAGEFDMQAILMHELGHTYFLDHSPDSKNVMFANYMWTQRFGPYADDVARANALYATRNVDRLRQLRSSNGGTSWSVVANDITTSSLPETRTTVAPAAAAAAGLYHVGWVLPGPVARMTRLRGDGDDFSFRSFGLYPGFRPIGNALAADDAGTVLWAGVFDDDQGTIRILSSPDQGFKWYWANAPAGAATYGVPGLCWTRVGGQSTWILVWAHFDRADQPGTGFIRASTSIDNAQTWSAPIVVSTLIKVLSGVSAAANNANYIMLAAARAPANAGALNTANTIWSLAAAVVGRALQGNVWVFFSQLRTPTQPALALDSTHDEIVLAFAEQNSLSSLSTIHRPRIGGTWSPLTNLTIASNSAPALASSRDWSETVLWFAHD